MLKSLRLWTKKKLHVRQHIFNGGHNFLLNRPILGSQVYEGSVTSGAHVGPQSVVGRHCSIGPDTAVERSVLHDRVVVGSDAIIRESIIGAGARIGDTSLGEAIMGGGRDVGVVTLGGPAGDFGTGIAFCGSAGAGGGAALGAAAAIRTCNRSVVSSGPSPGDTIRVRCTTTTSAATWMRSESASVTWKVRRATTSLRRRGSSSQ